MQVKVEAKMSVLMDTHFESHEIEVNAILDKVITISIQLLQRLIKLEMFAFMNIFTLQMWSNLT